MKSESNPSSSTVRAKSLMPRARSGPSPSQMYDGRKTPNRSTSAMCHRPPQGSVVVGSATAVDRVALVEEGLGAFEHVVAGEHPLRGVGLGDQAGRDLRLDGEVDESLGLPQRDRAALGDLLADLHRAGDGLTRRDHFVDQTDAL